MKKIANGTSSISGDYRKFYTPEEEIVLNNPTTSTGDYRKFYTPEEDLVLNNYTWPKSYQDANDTLITLKANPQMDEKAREEAKKHLRYLNVV